MFNVKIKIGIKKIQIIIKIITGGKNEKTKICKGIFSRTLQKRIKRRSAQLVFTISLFPFGRTEYFRLFFIGKAELVL